MRLFAEFVKHDQDLHACCRIAKEDANDDPEAYDCEACEVQKTYATFHRDPVNVRAWVLFRKLTTRFLFDAQAVGQVFDRLTRDMSPEEYDDTLARVALFYDVFYPDEKAEQHGP